MRLFQQFRFKDAKVPTAPQRLERAISLLHARGWTNYDLRFYFDHTIHASIATRFPAYRPVDACDRVLKRFPEMRPYYSIHPETPPSKDTTSVISNLTHEWDAWNPNTSIAIPDPDAILEIARGVPRSFPLNHVVYILDKIQWGGTKSTSPDAIVMKRTRSARFPGMWEPYDCLTLNHNWWTPRRFNEVTAHVELPVSDALTQFPEVAAPIRELLSSLGSIRGSVIIAYRSVKEEAGLAGADQTAAKLRDELMAEEKTQTFFEQLPHRLSSHGAVIPEGSATRPIPFKKIITPRVKRLGYRHAGHLGFFGFMAYSKLTPNNNIVLLEFDFGRWYSLMRCEMRVKGPTWENSVEVRLADSSELHQISSPEIVEHATDNAVEVAKWLEDRYVGPLETIYGPAPVWFKYFV